MDDFYSVANGKQVMLRPGMKLILAEDCEHGDYKTASVSKDRWPTLKKGTEVILVEIWRNCYGIQFKVKASNGELYDIEVHKADIE